MPYGFESEYIGRVLFTPDDIQRAVVKTARQIENDYINEKNIMLLGLLSGAAPFLCDLSR